MAKPDKGRTQEHQQCMGRHFENKEDLKARHSAKNRKRNSRAVANHPISLRKLATTRSIKKNGAGVSMISDTGALHVQEERKITKGEAVAVNGV